MAYRTFSYGLDELPPLRRRSGHWIRKTTWPSRRTAYARIWRTHNVVCTQHNSTQDGCKLEDRLFRGAVLELGPNFHLLVRRQRSSRPCHGTPCGEQQMERRHAGEFAHDTRHAHDSNNRHHRERRHSTCRTATRQNTRRGRTAKSTNIKATEHHT